MPKSITIFALAIVLAGSGFPSRADSDHRTPILVELFTSEGCSSCPPVDEWAQNMDKTQPVPNAEVIVLSEHVDYWNHDGWKDRYSSGFLTERQNSYAQALRVPEVYTPQVIVDGTDELKFGDANRIAQVFSKDAAMAFVPVRIQSMTVDGDDSQTVRGQVDVEIGTHAGEVFAAIALHSAESQVLRGENSGKHLTHVGVVLSLKKIGKLEAGKAFSQSVQFKVKSGSDAGNVRLVAFVQEPGPGRVLGAAIGQAATK